MCGILFPLYSITTTANNLTSLHETYDSASKYIHSYNNHQEIGNKKCSHDEDTMDEHVFPKSMGDTRDEAQKGKKLCCCHRIIQANGNFITGEVEQCRTT